MSENNPVSKIKTWLFPTLISVIFTLSSVVSMMVLRDISELRSDVKQLLAQSYMDKIEIENLKQRLKEISESQEKEKSKSEPPAPFLAVYTKEDKLKYGRVIRTFYNE